MTSGKQEKDIAAGKVKRRMTEEDELGGGRKERKRERENQSAELMIPERAALVIQLWTALSSATTEAPYLD